MSACADCGLTVSEIKNQVILKSNIEDIQKYDEHIVNWILNAEREIATFNGLHQNNNVKLDLGSGTSKIPLPDDVYTLQDVCFGTTPAMYTGVSSFFNKNCGCGGTSCGCIRWHENGCYIHTNRDVTSCTISYLSLPVDEEGMPYIKATHLEAVVAYIKLALLEARFDEGKIGSFVYQTRYNQWIRKKAAARAKDEMPNDAEMSRLANIWNSKLPVNYRTNTGRNSAFILVPL